MEDLVNLWEDPVLSDEDKAKSEEIARQEAILLEKLESDPSLLAIIESGDEKAIAEILGTGINAKTDTHNPDVAETNWDFSALDTNVFPEQELIAVPRVKAELNELSDLGIVYSSEQDTSLDIQEYEYFERADYITEEIVHSEQPSFCPAFTHKLSSDVRRYLDSYIASLDTDLQGIVRTLDDLQDLIFLDQLCLLSAQEHVLLTNWGIKIPDSIDDTQSDTDTNFDLSNLLLSATESPNISDYEDEDEIEDIESAFDTSQSGYYISGLDDVPEDMIEDDIDNSALLTPSIISDDSEFDEYDDSEYEDESEDDDVDLSGFDTSDDDDDSDFDTTKDDEDISDDDDISDDEDISDEDISDDEDTGFDTSADSEDDTDIEDSGFDTTEDDEDSGFDTTEDDEDSGFDTTEDDEDDEDEGDLDKSGFDTTEDDEDDYDENDDAEEDASGFDFDDSDTEFDEDDGFESDDTDSDFDTLDDLEDTGFDTDDSDEDDGFASDDEDSGFDTSEDDEVLADDTGYSFDDIEDADDSGFDIEDSDDDPMEALATLVSDNDSQVSIDDVDDTGFEDDTEDGEFESMENACADLEDMLAASRRVPVSTDFTSELSSNPLQSTDLGIPSQAIAPSKPKDKNAAAADAVLAIYNKLHSSPSALKHLIGTIFMKE